MAVLGSHKSSAFLNLTVSLFILWHKVHKLQQIKPARETASRGNNLQTMG